MHSFSGAIAFTECSISIYLQGYDYAVLHRLRADVEFVAL